MKIFLILKSEEIALAPAVSFREKKSCNHPGTIREMSSHYKVKFFPLTALNEIFS